MNSRVFVRLISIFLALIGSIVLGWYRLPWLLGTAQAYLSLQQGRYVSLSYGMPFREYPEYQRFLKSKFDVEDRTIAGCVVMESLLAYADAYNRVTEKL